jgi:asparagine synthase (glutamine-hydrolysing)
MRRALAGIVPDEILNRKRKAFAVHTPIAAISGHWSSLAGSEAVVVTQEIGIIDSLLFSQALELATKGRNVSIVQLARTLTMELWLQQLVKAGVVAVEKTGVALENLQFRDISAEVNAN